MKLVLLQMTRVRKVKTTLSEQRHMSQMSQMSQTRSILKMKIALSLLQLREIVTCFSTVEAPYVKG